MATGPRDSILHGTRGTRSLGDEARRCAVVVDGSKAVRSRCGRYGEIEVISSEARMSIRPRMRDVEVSRSGCRERRGWRKPNLKSRGLLRFEKVTASRRASNHPKGNGATRSSRLSRPARSPGPGEARCRALLRLRRGAGDGKEQDAI